MLYECVQVLFLTLMARAISSLVECSRRTSLVESELALDIVQLSVRVAYRSGYIYLLAYLVASAMIPYRKGKNFLAQQ